jgi:hypothetical protein
VSSGQGRKKLRRPRPAIAAIQGKALINLQGVIRGKCDQEPLAAHVQKIFVVLNTIETIAVGYLILVNENLMGALERWRNDETAAFVIKTGQDDRR